jgi:uncharacterized protein YbcI
MKPDDPTARDGELNAAIATAVVRVIATFTGHGPTRSRAIVDGDVVVCLLEDCMTKAERNLVAAGSDELVRQLRERFQRETEPEMVAAVERLTGRTVATFMSGTSTAGNTDVEVFVLEPGVAEGGRGVPVPQTG